MSERNTLQSYIIRIYRVDSDDPGKLAGLVEAVDGSGERMSFTNLAELALLLVRQ